MSTAILITTALAALGLAEGLYSLIRYSGDRKRAELRQRLRAQDVATSTSLFREQRVARNPVFEGLIEGLPFTKELETLLHQTSLDWTVAMMHGLSILCAAGLGIGGFILGGRSPLVSLLAGALGLAVPTFVALGSRSRRSSALSAQLPEALDTMVRSLRAGHGLSAAFRLVAQELPMPASIEFARCFEEMNIGVEFRDAVTHMTERVPGNLDLKIFAVSVALQHDTGGNLIEILDQISGTIRERFKFEGKLASLTAEARMSGLVLGALPPFLLVYMLSANPDYLSVLGTDPIGPYFITAGLVLWSSGLFWMYQLAQVKF